MEEIFASWDALVPAARLPASPEAPLRSRRRSVATHGYEAVTRLRHLTQEQASAIEQFVIELCAYPLPGAPAAVARGDTVSLPAGERAAAGAAQAPSASCRRCFISFAGGTT